MKNFLVITCGGTIVCEASSDGLSPASSTQELEQAFRELDGSFSFLALMNMDSSRMSSRQWREILCAVDQNKGRYDGIIITHGTDTMAYTACALALSLKNIPLPVVLTGSQIPLGEEGSDAPDNLRLAVQCAASALKGVYIAFSGAVIDGRCASKVYSKNKVAFESINAPYVDLHTGSSVCGPYEMNLDFCEKVFLLKLFPGVESGVLELLADAGYLGIVIEGYGLGGMPEAFCEKIAQMVKRGIRVWVTTQCLHDGSDYTVYEPGRKVLEAGAEDCGKRTAECAVVELMKKIAQ